MYEVFNSEQYVPSTPLMFAARDGRIDTVQQLLRVDKSPDTATFTDEEGMSALIWASLSGHTDIVDVLLDHRATVNPTALQHTAIRAAASRGHVNVVSQLLHAGADPDLRSKGGRTALMGAAMNGHEEAVKTLLSGGADPSLANELDETAQSLAKTARIANLIRNEKIWRQRQADKPRQQQVHQAEMGDLAGKTVLVDSASGSKTLRGRSKTAKFIPG